MKWNDIARARWQDDWHAILGWDGAAHKIKVFLRPIVHLLAMICLSGRQSLSRLSHMWWLRMRSSGSRLQDCLCPKDAWDLTDLVTSHLTSSRPSLRWPNYLTGRWLFCCWPCWTCISDQFKIQNISAQLKIFLANVLLPNVRLQIEVYSICLETLCLCLSLSMSKIAFWLE